MASRSKKSAPASARRPRAEAAAAAQPPEKPTPRIVTVGSASIDVIVLAAPGRVERAKLDSTGAGYLLLEEGRKYPAETIATHVGGGGANAATCAARLGWRSAVLGVVGEDRDGAAVIDHLALNRVDVATLRRDRSAETGVSVMIASERRNFAIMVRRGANEALRAEDVSDAVFEGAALVYIAPLSGASADCFPALVEQGSWAGALVAANPGERQLSERAEAFFGALGNVKLLSLNTRELSVLASRLMARGAVEADSGESPAESAEPDERREPRLFSARLGEGDRKAPFQKLLAALHELGPRYLSITDGAQGAYLSAAAPAAPPRLLFEPAAPVETVRGAAGAGDAYGATLACLLAEGAAPEAAMRRAALNAASVVSELDTTTGLLERATLEARAAEAERDRAP